MMLMMALAAIMTTMVTMMTMVVMRRRTVKVITFSNIPLHTHQFAEDTLNAILVNLAVLGLGGDSNKQDKAENLHADLEMWIVLGKYMRCLKIWTRHSCKP